MIPLRSGEPQARLDLRAALDRIYDDAYYQTYIYQGAPHPALAPDDAAWVRPFIPAAQ